MSRSVRFADVNGESFSLHFVARLALAVNERPSLIMEIKDGV